MESPSTQASSIMEGALLGGGVDSDRLFTNRRRGQLSYICRLREELSVSDMQGGEQQRNKKWVGTNRMVRSSGKPYEWEYSKLEQSPEDESINFVIFRSLGLSLNNLSSQMQNVASLSPGPHVLCLLSHLRRTPATQILVQQESSGFVCSSLVHSNKYHPEKDGKSPNVHCHKSYLFSWIKISEGIVWFGPSMVSLWSWTP